MLAAAVYQPAANPAFIRDYRKLFMEILLFGITREITGRQRLTVPAAENINTVGELKNWLSNQYPALRQLSSMAVAVDSVYAEESEALTAGSEVALIPPVSGG